MLYVFILIFDIEHASEMEVFVLKVIKLSKVFFFYVVC